MENLNHLQGIVFDGAVKLNCHSFAFFSFLPNGGMQNYAQAFVSEKGAHESTVGAYRGWQAYALSESLFASRPILCPSWTTDRLA